MDRLHWKVIEHDVSRGWAVLISASWFTLHNEFRCSNHAISLELYVLPTQKIMSYLHLNCNTLMLSCLALLILKTSFSWLPCMWVGKFHVSCTWNNIFASSTVNDKSDLTVQVPISVMQELLCKSSKSMSHTRYADIRFLGWGEEWVGMLYWIIVCTCFAWMCGHYNLTQNHYLKRCGSFISLFMQLSIAILVSYFMN